MKESVRSPKKLTTAFTTEKGQPFWEGGQVGFDKWLSQIDYLYLQAKNQSIIVP